MNFKDNEMRIFWGDLSFSAGPGFKLETKEGYFGLMNGEWDDENLPFRAVKISFKKKQLEGLISLLQRTLEGMEKE